MAERMVTVHLIANVSNYIAGIEQAKRATKEVTDEAEKARLKAEAQSQALNQIGTGLVAVGAIAMVGVGMAVKKFADFDQAMSNVSAVTMETADNMSLLRDAALDAGARTVFSATEAANAIEELGKAGVSTSDILDGGLNAALDLAAAGGLEVADAAGIAAVAMKTFNLRGTDMSHVADLLAAGAGKAMGDVTDLSMALRQSGQVAASTGLSIEETTAALSAFASQGLIGSDAGTSFKAMLQRLTPQSKEAADKMQALGISAYDASGNFIGLEALAGNLQDSLKGLTVEQRNSAFATIFGSDAVRAANVLYTEGAKGIGEWVKQVDDSGYAAEVASRRLDNLKGDFEKLTGAIDTAFIKSGSGANDVLRGLTQAATETVDNFADLPDWLQQTAFWITGLTGAATLASGAFILGVPKIQAYKTALAELGPVAQRLGGIVGALGKGLAISAVISVAIGAIDAMKNAIEGDTLALEKYNNIVQTSTSSQDLLSAAFKDTNWLGYGVQWKELSKDVKSFGELIDQVQIYPDLRGLGAFGDVLLLWRSGANQARDQFDALGTALAGLPLEQSSSQLMQLRDSYNLTDEQLMDLIDLMPEYKAALTEAASSARIEVNTTDESVNKKRLLKFALDEASAGAREHADKLKQVSGAADDASGEISDLEQLIRGFGSATLDARSAERDFQQAVDDAAAALAANGATLDTNTQQGRDNQAALDAMAQAANNSAAASYQLTGDQAALEAQLAAAREQVYQQGIAFGLSEEEARRFADSAVASKTAIENIPTSRSTKLTVDDADARAKIAAFQAYMSTLSGGVAIFPRFSKASGGILPGAPSNRDNMFIHAASGEFVVRASQTAIPANRRALEYINRGGVINGYANGGMVQPNYVSGRGSSQPVSVTAGVPDVYVQNPFTGDYLLATVDSRATQVMKANDTRNAVMI